MNDKTSFERLSDNKTLFIFVSIVLVVSVFLANFLLAFIQSIGTTIQQFSVNPDNTSFSLDWKSFFHFQGNWMEYYIGFYLLVGIGLLKFVYNIKINYSSLNKGQHGTGEFETVKNLKRQYQIIPGSKKEYKGSGGVIISGLQEKPLLPFMKRPYRLLIDNAPVHTLVIGITRSGKGETFVVPMLDVLSRAKDKPSIVVNDPKGELAAASYDTLIERGYEVHVFNLLQQHMGMGFNPLQLVVDAWKKGNTSLAQQYANSVAFSLYYEPNAKDPFWTNSAKSLVTAIILALTEDSVATGKEEKVHLYSVANFLSTLGSDNDENGNNALDLFFQARDEKNPARMMYATSNFAAGNTRASIFSTAMDKLQIFTLEPNAKLTSYNSLKLTDVGFGEKPVAIFMVTPDFDSSNHVLASIFVSQLYRVNAEQATKSKGSKMKRHVHFMLDEFGNMPTVEGMASMVTVGAGRGFRFHLIVQAYSQLKTKYGQDADTIIGNCSNQIYILTKDKQTAEQYSALIGTKTITDVSRSGHLFSNDKSHSESTKERPLLMPDELMNKMNEGESVVVRANKRQDMKRRKIVPKPIFNSLDSSTYHKFRYEYLADDFDTSKSILDLPIMSQKYHELDLNEMVFTSKTENDQYINMLNVMGREAFQKLKEDLQKAFISSGEEFNEIEMMNQWSFLHLLSFLTYESRLALPMMMKVYQHVRLYLPDSIFVKWEEKTKDVREKQHRERLENLDAEENKDEIRKALI